MLIQCSIKIHHNNQWIITLNQHSKHNRKKNFRIAALISLSSHSLNLKLTRVILKKTRLNLNLIRNPLQTMQQVSLQLPHLLLHIKLEIVIKMLQFQIVKLIQLPKFNLRMITLLHSSSLNNLPIKI